MKRRGRRSPAAAASPGLRSRGLSADLNVCVEPFPARVRLEPSLVSAGGRLWRARGAPRVDPLSPDPPPLRSMSESIINVYGVPNGTTAALGCSIG